MMLIQICETYFYILYVTHVKFSEWSRYRIERRGGADRKREWNGLLLDAITSAILCVMCKLDSCVSCNHMTFRILNFVTRSSSLVSSYIHSLKFVNLARLSMAIVCIF